MKSPSVPLHLPFYANDTVPGSTTHFPWSSGTHPGSGLTECVVIFDEHLSHFGISLQPLLYFSQFPMSAFSRLLSHFNSPDLLSGLCVTCLREHFTGNSTVSQLPAAWLLLSGGIPPPHCFVSFRSLASTEKSYCVSFLTFLRHCLDASYNLPTRLECGSGGK